MSSLSTTAFSARMVRWPAVMTSALVSLSAQIVAMPPSSETVAGPVEAGAAAGCAGPRAAEPEEPEVPLPVSCPLRRPARSSASGSSTGYQNGSS
jgi:hypothetical protein